ncbi:MAG: SIS domain-containing protein [Pyrinomonadaceae bacterium]
MNLSRVEKASRGLTYTPTEINQQPSSWLETFRILEEIQADIQIFLKKSGWGESNDGTLTVSLIGAGTSDYIGRALAGLLRREWRCHVQTIPSTDLLTEMHEVMASAPVKTRHLWISFSRSGDSFEGVHVIQTALEKYPQINHLIVTCNKDGKMANDLSHGRSNVFCITLDDKVNDRGLAMTSSFTNMVIVGQCLAHILNLDLYKPILGTLVAAANGALHDIAALANRMADRDHARICFLGSGPLKAVGDESSLKVMELTAGYYCVMSESFLGLRHGPLSWLNEDSMVVGFLSNDPEKITTELGLLDELKSKNIVKDIIVIAPQTIDPQPSADHWLTLDIPETMADHYRPPLDVIFAQCLGLFSSLRRNLKPDTPSVDGKIQRVVSQIKIKELHNSN